jgi:flagellar biosynthetic protein FliR
MGESLFFMQNVTKVLSNMSVVFTFILLVIRFSAMFLMIPGIGAAQRGIAAKYSAILLFAYVAIYTSPIVPLPSDLGRMVGMMLSELALGACIGLIPLLMVAALQNAGQISSTSMGLQAGAVMDPSTGVSVAELAKIFGDLFILAFLYTNSHHILFMAASGLNGRLVPGSFLVGESTLEFVVQRSADIFHYGLLFAAPIVVALLLTNFVMGLISKAVPTVNIFIVSFPLTIGIGLILTLLMIPELMQAAEKLIVSTDNSIAVITEDATLR